MSANQKGKRLGTANGRAKLDEAKVAQIKTLLKNGLHPQTIANIFDVGRTAIDDIRSGKRWTQVQCPTL